MTSDAPPRVSVIIPTKNRSAMLREALGSVRALDGSDLELEIIVADNGSTDDTEAVARAFGARVVHTLTPGAAAVRNAGLRVATGDYLAFLDDDDRWLPGHLRPHLQLLAARPELDAVIGQVVNTDYAMASHASPWPEELPADGDLLANFLAGMPQIGATVVRACVRDTVGYLDETLLSDEDWDWHLRLALSHRIGFVATPCVLYRARPVGMRDDLFWMRVGFTRKVFWRNVRRARGRRPPAHTILRFYLRHMGRFAGGFLNSAVAHAATGDRRAAQRAIVRALRASALHVAWAAVHDAKVRRAVAVVAAPWKSSRRDQSESAAPTSS